MTSLEFYAGDARRYVIASDGLWETLSLERIAKCAFMHEDDPQKCASSLLKSVRLECARLNGVREQPFKDDTTVVVVDITPAPFSVSVRRIGRLTPTKRRPWLCCRSI